MRDTLASACSRGGSLCASSIASGTVIGAGSLAPNEVEVVEVEAEVEGEGGAFVASSSALMKGRNERCGGGRLAKASALQWKCV